MNSLEHIDPRWAWQPFFPSPDQPWDRRRAAHLFRRAGFGADKRQLEAALQRSPAELVDGWLQEPAGGGYLPPDAEELAAAVLATGDPRQLAAWWCYVCLHTPDALRERMTLFWHGHFATSAEKVRDAALMLEQNRLLRREALGNFRKLTHSIARDPAMLIYLDSATNRKAHANENFARELMELFSLGEGHYTEQDVRELARCFTGWEVRGGKFRFNRFQHDGGIKTILGRTDGFPDAAAVDWVLDQPQAGRFIAGKLFRQFICDEPAPPPALLEPLAVELREHDWNLAGVLRRILTSQIFFSPHAVARKVRSPVDLAVGLLRSLAGSTNTVELAAALQQIGQGLFYPPSVKGWDGGRAWINSSTILGRANMIGKLVHGEHTRFGGEKLGEYFAGLGATSAEQIVELFDEFLVAVPLSQRARAELVELCNQPGDMSQQIATALHALAALPEFQLG